MLQGKVENLELKAEIRSLKLKDNVEEDNESFQHQQTKGKKNGLIRIGVYVTVNFDNRVILIMRYVSSYSDQEKANN
jgi:hypothetical protein